MVLVMASLEMRPCGRKKNCSAQVHVFALKGRATCQKFAFRHSENHLFHNVIVIGATLRSGEFRHRTVLASYTFFGLHVEDSLHPHRCVCYFFVVTNIDKHIEISLDIFNTSSTARGGGGSFETTKTIGEIGCCESRMSEQKHWPTD